MSEIHILTYNPFQENTIVIESGDECVIIDPGAYSQAEKQDFLGFLSQLGSKVVRLLNTHCHLDHIFSNGLIHDKFGLPLEIHPKEMAMLKAAPMVGKNYGLPTEPSPEPGLFLEEGKYVEFGEERLEILFTPGHSPGSVCFYSDTGKYLIGGDVLFYESIGRTDLPGGDFNTLMESIKNKLLSLDDEVTVYPGHGPVTTIGHERYHNPFIRQYG